ncbi:hypothetical protein JCM8547_005806 [Rhodosporidiobolus lusitaniae]
MSTTTQLASTQALPSLVHTPVLPALPPAAPQLAGCAHLAAFVGQSSPDAFEALVKASRLSFEASEGGGSKTAPSCATCQRSPLRAFSCLACKECSCGGAAGGGHAVAHSKKAGHTLAFDLRAKAVYCFSCADYVRSVKVERLVLAEQLGEKEEKREKAEGRAVAKRKRVSLQQWQSTAGEESSLVIPARGIRNLGNSCYMSVVLQTFFANPFLRAHYLGDRHNRHLCDKTRAGEPCLSCELDGLFIEHYATDQAFHAPTKFLHSFWQSSVEAAGYAQQDAHEFLISTLNLLHSSSPSSTDNPALPCPCIIHRTFSGSLRSAITCGRCGHQSETLEPFLDLSLDIRDRAKGTVCETVRGCLESFTSPEKLPSEYDCAACGPGVPSANKRLSLKSLPNVLCIQLKRFEHTSTSSKLDAPVQYPLKLDMAPFLSSNIDYPAAAKSNPLNVSSKYNLTSVVAHEGTLSQGHYTAYVRGIDDYWAVDDDKVRRVRISDVLAAKAYLLVYSRV